MKNKIIKIDADPNQDYEVNGPLRKTINFFLIPILNNLPQRFFVTSSDRARFVHKHATTHKALEEIYSFNNKLSVEGGLLTKIYDII